MSRRVVLASLLLLLTGLLSPSLSIAAAGDDAAASGMLDCHGHSPIQKPIALLQCPDPVGRDDEGRFEDNGHYVGHDEPLTNFFSTKPGSGGSQQYRVRLPVEPSSPPSGSFSGPTWSFQNEIAFWFSMVLCDTESYPETTKVCTPNSDSNIQAPPRASHAGTAFLELQLYPPGYPPFGAISCDRSHWCAALAIFSVEANFDFSNQNGNCIEPGNFAFLTLSGKPIGPAGPDTVTVGSFTPNDDVLRMGQGDELSVSLFDSPAGITTTIDDLTTGQTGRMVGGAANGFRHILWDPVNHTCQGAPYSFHPMYDTAPPPNAQGDPRAWAVWTVHTSNVAYSAEVGHFEPPDGDEDDRRCRPGPGIPGCLATDTDFDGYSYHRGWPNGSPKFATPTYVSSPRSLSSPGTWTNTFSKVQFEADLPVVEEGTCDIFSGQGCTNPPPGASFYPWFHLAAIGSPSTCAWALSDDLPNQISNYGGGPKKGWGPLELIDYGADFVAYLNFARGPFANPCP